MIQLMHMRIDQIHLVTIYLKSSIIKIDCLHAQAHGTVDAFVEFILLDPTKDDEKQISSVIPNEPDPRWGQKFDFVMADANSNLLITVFDKKGGMESLVSLKTLAGELAPRCTIVHQEPLLEGQLPHETAAWPAGMHNGIN